MHLAVEDRRGEEEQAAGGEDGAAVVLRSCGGDAFRGEFGVGTEGDPPEVFASVHVDGVERPPGWGRGGVAVLVDEAFISKEAEGCGDVSGGGEFSCGDFLCGCGGDEIVFAC